jgi:hypothetical protein
MGIEDNPPFALYVAVPEQTERGYGVYATTHHDAYKMTLRMSSIDKDLIERNARKLNMDMTTFMRQAATNVARAIERHEKEKEKSDEHDRNRS